MNLCEKFILYILLPLEYILIITYLILIIILGFKNIKYNKYNSKEIIKERVLYEQISYEIYNSIKSNILLDLRIEEKCENNYQPINFMIKLNPSFNFKYITNITHLFNKQFCIPIYEKFRDKYNQDELKYEELLKNSVNLNQINNRNDDNNSNNINNICKSGYKPCGILDTMNNILCLPKKYKCPLNDMQISYNYDSILLNNNYSEVILENNISIYLNNEENIDRPIIVSYFLSYDKPLDHEWDILISNKDEDKKSIKYLFENYDKFMINSSFCNSSLISLDDILKWEANNEKLNLLIKETEPSKNYYLFHKNYIGFKNYEELNKFKKLFNIDDYKDNPLFKLSKTLRPYIASIVLGFLLLIFYIFHFFYGLRNDFFDSDLYIILFMVGAVISFIYFIVYIALYFSDKVKFKKMEFEFDEQIQIVFNLYSKRIRQPIYDAIIIILFLTMTPHFVFIGAAIVVGTYELIKNIKYSCNFCGLF